MLFRTLADPFVRFVDFIMRAVVGPVCLAFAALLASGCSLTDQSRGSADFGFRSKDASGLNRKDDSSGNRISFKAPKRKSSSSTDDSDLAKGTKTKQFKPGAYSLDDLGTDAVADSSDRKTTDAPDQPIEKTRSEQRKVATRNGEEPLSAGDSARSRVRQVTSRSTDDAGKTSIQLQGLEFDNSSDSDASRSNHPPGSDDLPVKSNAPDRSMASSLNAGTGPEIQPWSNRVAQHSNPLMATNSSSASKDEQANSAQVAGPNEESLVQKVVGQLPALPWQNELDQLITRAERDLAQSKPDSNPEKQNEYLRKQAHLRMLYLMAQRQEDALTAIPGVEPTQQEFWQQMIWAMSNSFDTVQFPDLNERSAQAVPPLSAALRLMREEAALSIKNMTFCRKISYFGNYERFPRNEFTPGYEVLLYTEIENFVSTPTVDGEYRTSLKSVIEITDAKGRVVWTKGFPPTEDFCRNPRRDYFHNYQFHIPEELPTGTYSLKLTIVDELSHKRVSNSLNFVLK